MSKPYSEADFSAQITQDRSWRPQGNIRLEDRHYSGRRQPTLRAAARRDHHLLRSLGRIRSLRRAEIPPTRGAPEVPAAAISIASFSGNYFLPRLTALSTTKMSIAERCALVDEYPRFVRPPLLAGRNPT